MVPFAMVACRSEGSRIDEATHDFAYAVLFDLDASQDFLAALSDSRSPRLAFIVKPTTTKAFRWPVAVARIC